MKKICRNLSRACCVAIIVSLCAGCDLLSTDPLAPAHGTAIYNYAWGLVNYSNSRIGEVTLYLKRQGQLRYLASTGVLLPEPLGHAWGSSECVSATPLRVPDHVIVEWGGGRQDISLIGIVDPKVDEFKGTIWLCYIDGEWYPAALTDEETKWRVSHGQTAAPVPSITQIGRTSGKLGD